MEKSEEKSVKRSRESSPIDLSPVKKLRCVEAVKDEAQGSEGDSCQNLGPSVSFHKNYEEKLAELEKNLWQAKKEAHFYFRKAKEIDSRLQDLQRENLQNQNASQSLTEESGENDEATSDFTTAQSGCDKWTCRLCASREASVAVRPCCHLCLCFFCAKFKEPEKCPVCGARQKEFFFVRNANGGFV